MRQLHTQDYLGTDHILAIGLVACEWSLLEAHLSVCIWRMLGVEWEHGHILTDDLSPAARIHMFHAIAVVTFREDSKPLKEAGELFSELQCLATERNNLVHNVWHVRGRPETLVAQKFSARGCKFKAKPLEKTVTELMQLPSKIGALSDELVMFDKRNFGELPPLPPRRGKQD